MAFYYVLVDRKPVACRDAADYDQRVTNGAHGLATHIARTNTDSAWVSTVFLGVNHQRLKDEPPVLFETMVFGGESDGLTVRTMAWARARSTHLQVVAIVVGKRLTLWQRLTMLLFDYV